MIRRSLAVALLSLGLMGCRHRPAPQPDAPAALPEESSRAAAEPEESEMPVASDAGTSDVPDDDRLTGALDSEQLKPVMRKGQKDVRECYMASVRDNPDLEGRVRVGILVEEGGRVEGVSILESTLNSDAVHDCLRAKIANWSYPDPGGPFLQRTWFDFKRH